jgi:hypothetical protein
LKSILAADLLVGDNLILTSTTGAKDANGYTTLVASHCMSIYGFDTATGDFEIRNPWGAPFGEKAGRKFDTTFEESLKALQADGDLISVDNVGAATTSVSGASVVAAAGLQAMTQIKSFSVTDNVKRIDAGLAGLISDTKLTSVSVTGTKSADSLDLAGLAVAAFIDMRGDTDSASVAGYFSLGVPGVAVADSLNLGSGYDSITLGSGAATIDFALGAGGVENVSNFNAAQDLFSINLAGATSLEQTLVNGGDWISSATDVTHGVFLAGVTSAQRYSVSGGIATVA